MSAPCSQISEEGAVGPGNVETPHPAAAPRESCFRQSTAGGGKLAVAGDREGGSRKRGRLG
eukprot:9298255-Pyramimonas_sp.AAC.1